jgi:hypothetical protein
MRLEFLQLLQARANQLCYYDYGYCHPETGIWRYVGEGHTKDKYDRKTDHLEYAKRLDLPAKNYPNPRLIYWIRKLLRKGLEPKIVILKSGMSQEEAYAQEQKFIARIGRIEDGGTLYNFDSGGLGGKRHSEETRRKMSRAQSGKVVPSEVTRKNSSSNRRFWNSPEGVKQRTLNGQILTGKPAWNKGIFRTENEKDVISRGVKAHYASPKGVLTCEAISKATVGRLAWNKGIPRTENNKQRISFGVKLSSLCKKLATASVASLMQDLEFARYGV